MKKIEKVINLGGRELKLTTGELAGQADAAVLAQYGDTVVLATVVSAPLKVELDYFPLSVEYQERLYAGGKIKGSRWVKRDGRPSDEAILTGRLIDRSVRPLFPKAYMREVQVITTVLSVDMENSPVDVAPIAVSAALAASSIPWDGPVATLRVGHAACYRGRASGGGLCQRAVGVLRPARRNTRRLRYLRRQQHAGARPR